MKKQRILSFLSLFLLGAATSSCGNHVPEKITLSFYLWDRSMTRELTPWLEEQFPDIDFEFVVGQNSMDFYADLQSRGGLPDILSCRRFSLNDASHLAPYLLDLGNTNVAASFYEPYLRANREPGGAIRWLPVAAEVDGYAANLALFREHNVPIPTNYAEFVSAMNAFEQLGIRGYVNDYGADYSCLEALQGCSIYELNSLEGMAWRALYESEDRSNPVGLDDVVWPKVFRNFEQYIKDTHLTSEDASIRFADIRQDFLDGKIAMIRVTGGDCMNLRSIGMDAAMLPYYGPEAKDSWLLTYPTCQIALGKGVESSSAKKNAALQVIAKMCSLEGQKKFSGNAASNLYYTQEGNAERNEVYSKVSNEIDSKRLYMRLASTEMFRVSQRVVQRMIRGELDAEQAYREFHSLLIDHTWKTEEEPLFHQDANYALTLTETGAKAPSSLLNTLTAKAGKEIGIGYAPFISAPIFEGDYTPTEVGYLVPYRVVLREVNLTGAEIRTLMEWLVNALPDGRNPVRHRTLLPVTSGMDLTVRETSKGRFLLKGLSVSGEPLEDHRSYSVFLCGDTSFIETAPFCNIPMPEGFSDKLSVVAKNQAESIAFLQSCFATGSPFAPPSEYLTIERE